MCVLVQNLNVVLIILEILTKWFITIFKYLNKGTIIYLEN